MNRRTFTVALVAVLAAAGCGGNEGPIAGELEVRLVTPNTDDRAILFRLVGAQTALTAPSGSGYRVLHGAPALTGDTVRVVVIAPQSGHIAAGTILRISVPDTRKAATYAALVQETASTSYTSRPASGYVLTVVAPGAP
jgi:hypothetical protein